MDIVKYFFEEPVLVEPVTPDTSADARRREGPQLPLDALLRTSDYHRGYLAGTNLSTGRVGFTALQNAEEVARALVEAFPKDRWTRWADEGVDALSPEAVIAEWMAPTGSAVLATGPTPPAPEALATVARGPRRDTLAALRTLLDDDALVCFREPAHDGSDWSLFAAHPLRATVVDVLGALTHPTMRQFVLPYQKARSESKFYFEQWQLTSLPTYITEL
ncbi:hypothetical protein [Salisaeta longa]|uniref:hypothetical protein n=1 Tax=Salisaeta longa TaxID=503170 RepID=UPI0003B44686|nr:hypothetical protein [Salisaeta longa]